MAETDLVAAQVKADADEARLLSELNGYDDRSDPFVAAVRATRMPMIITNPRLPDNPSVFINDAFCRMSGYSREEILGRNCRFLQGPETDRSDVDKIRGALQAAKPIQLDIRNHRKDGTGFWNRLLMAPVFDATGELAYFFASQVDVTLERERLEGLQTNNAALMAELTGRLHIQEEREREMAYAMQAGRFGTWSLEFAGMELTTSETFRQLFGRVPGEPFSHADHLASILPEDRALVETALKRVMEERADYDVTYRIVRPDGAVQWLASRGQAFTNAAGRPLRMAGVSRDVTLERRAERMRAALIRLSDVFRQKDDPDEISSSAAELIGQTLGVSRAGYGLVDPAAETFTVGGEWSAAGVDGLPRTLHFRDFGSYIDDLKRGRTAIVADARLDGRTREGAAALEAIAARAFVNMPLTEQEGLVALLYLTHADAREWPEDELSFIRDVAERTREATERRRVEKALASLAASLETQVAERTRELMAMEETLRQSQKMEAVGQLTGGLAHDFNNLLTGITGSLELLQTRIQQGRVEDVNRYVTAAQDAATRAAALTHRLLAFSRRQTLAPQRTDVNVLVAGMKELIQRTVGPEITVEALLADDLWSTLIDASQLENALLNLCLNARDAMPDGGKITVETRNGRLDARAAREREVEPGPYVCLSVSDNGTGMSPDVIAKAFEPFFTTKPIGQGTGLGLSMIYGFTKQSGGQVCIYSEVGQGTTICLYLPQHAGAETEGDRSPGLGEAPRAEQGETVLVVDDEPTIRMLVAEVLEDLGYRAIEAADGAAGLKVLRSDARIDLLVTDVGLPGGINGRQVADAARVVRPALKVLFITGYAEQAAISHGHLDPGMHVLTKPFAIEVLAKRIKDVIST